MPGGRQMQRSLCGILLLTVLGWAAGLSLSRHETEDQLQQVFTKLTDPDVYDKNVRPFPGGDQPVDVRTRTYVYFLGDLDAQSSEFFVQLLLRQRWHDPRLQYNVSEKCVQGEEWHKSRMWVPTIYLVNQKDAKIIDVSSKNVFVNVCPDGAVYFSYRIKTTLFCSMNLRKFPFDNQTCSVLLESWQHSMFDMVMTWEDQLPFSADDISLAEYSLTDIKVRNASFHFPETTVFSDVKWRVSRPEAEYSRLVLDFYMSREPGYYLLDYYIPSGFLVIVSWVSFWLSPDAAPARVTLGTSTMLTFITLSNTIKNSLPKVSYTKFVDIWLFICTTFIFLSLVEFAFVNTIHRRKKNVTLKKVTTKHVLKSTLARSASRDSLSGTRHGGAVNYGLSRSCGMLDNIGKTNVTHGPLLVPPSPTPPSRPTIFFVEDTDNDSVGQEANGLRKRDGHQLADTQDSHTNSPAPSEAPSQPAPPRRASVFPRPFVELTPPQIAKWIDTRSRWFFPLCFLACNIVYWISIVI